MFKLRSCRAAALCAASMLFTLAAASPQEAQIDRVLKQLEQVRSFSGVSISPDGKWVAWIQSAQDNENNAEIYVVNSTDPSTKPQRVTAGDGKKSFREAGVAWSPDSTELAFLSNVRSAQD